MRKAVLSFLAHPDDAEILCAGTLIRLKEAGWEIHIATATAGDCGTMDRNRWDISSIRTQEAPRRRHASQREWLLKHHGMDQYLKAMRDWSAHRGQACGVACAEGFRQHLGHSYPQDNVLEKLLGAK